MSRRCDTLECQTRKWPLSALINSGNVGVKLVQTFGKADAYGLMLQGFVKIVCDCSRGAPVSEIVGNIAISVVRAQSYML